MLNVIKLGFVGIALFVFWKLKSTPFGQTSFLIYFVAVFFEGWVASQVTSKSRVQNDCSSETSVPLSIPQDTKEQSAPRGIASTLVGIFVLFIMADSFFFTEWLDLPPSEGKVGWATVLALLLMGVTLAAWAAAFLGPILVGVLVLIGVNDRLERPGREPRSGILGCFPAVLVTVACFGHFYLAYLFYESVGALRGE